MQKCDSCGSEVAQATRFCASCGKPIPTEVWATIDADATLPPVSKRPSSRPPSSRPSSHSTRNEGRFTPGSLVAGRYRIVALLGRGGMGEVYRADDLSLGQQVALKFLPEFASDEQTLERFRNEVRIARRISHPNVCRVFDIGQTDDLVFFTMEYIDGEDLASLLRRIGRLPSDKAAEIAGKICAGVAAAHDKGILHRDLKPANVMLDGRGEVLITDFGLAGVAHEIEDVRSGTPAYMAPEQLSGEAVTIKSDIYSLGLVLYEVFTGKAAFDGKTLEEIVRVRRESTPSRPSSLVRDLDPSVERAILHCLEADPDARPASALAVAAALPGGDALAAAIAAGETPSPQIVAAAGETTGLKLPVALAALAIALVGLVASYLLGARTSAIERMDLPYSSDVLSQKARDIVQQFGYTATPADTADGFSYDDNYLDYLHDNPKQRTTWDAALKGRPPVLVYWLRESPSEMVGAEMKDSSLVPGIVDLSDPPPILSGMVQISLDPQGRLNHLEVIPPQVEKTPAPAAAFDWNLLFKLAGLDPAQFKSAEPTWNSLAAADTRVAWTGTWPGTTYPLRVEAASWRGKPVFFTLIGDWTKPDRIATSGDSSRRQGRRPHHFQCCLCATGGCGPDRPPSLCPREGRCSRSVAVGSRPVCGANGPLCLAGALRTIRVKLWAVRSGRRRRSVHHRGGLRSLSCHRTLRPAALAARHHFLEPAYGRATPRPPGRQRSVVRGDSGSGLGDHLFGVFPHAIAGW